MGFMDRFRSRRPQQEAAPAWRPGWDPSTPRFSVVDVETTGLRPEAHRVVEIAVVTTDSWGRVLDKWATRVNPRGPVGATHIHGITDADVATAPTFDQILNHLTFRLAGSALVAHNAKFDIAFLLAEYDRAGWDFPLDTPYLCTLEASQQHLPHLERRRLADCCWALGLHVDDAHSALGDAMATTNLLSAFMHPTYGTPPSPDDLQLPIQARSVPWPTSATHPPTPWTAPAPSRMDELPERVQSRIHTEAAARHAPAPALVELVERFSLVDALDEGAPDGSITYLEKLAEVLEDGEITDDEAEDLTAVANTLNLDPHAVTQANRAFIQALAHAALDDGKISRAERAELKAVSELLQVDSKLLPALLERAEHARNFRLSTGLQALPDTWAHGEPLRVGDKVVFTGCDDHTRNALEQRSQDLGVRILSTVSPHVAMLVTDGTMNGTKAARASELGTRTVHPDIYAALLAHLQPAIPRDLKPLPPSAWPAPTAPTTVTAAPPQRPTPTEAASIDPATVRRWGRLNGWDVGTRGRLPRELIDAYLAANSA